jgi:N-acetylglucosamine-6-phosphate deacetylase
MVEFTRMVSAGDGIARMMTIAPEVKGAASIIAAGVNRGMVMALGHSLALEAEVDEAVRAGATLTTHLFNAMPPMHHRTANLTSIALTDDRIACTCIYDRVHISRAALRTALRCKPPGLLALVSDATAALEAPDGGFEADGVHYEARGGRVTLKGTRTLAGSAVSLATAVHYVAQDGGVSFEEAWRLGSAAPAGILGVAAAKGEIAAGKDGDLVVLDEDGRVRATVVRGTLIHGSPDPA